MTKDVDSVGDDEVIILTSKSKEAKLEEREEKRKKISKGYYDIPEEEMQLIIERAKNGDQAAQAKLLLVFANFPEKYVNLLGSKYYDLRDYDIKRFINLYVPDPVLRQKVRKDNLNLKSYHQVTKIIQGITGMVQRYNDEEDIRQTINMTFLECVLHYEKRGPIPFSGYLYKFFFFVLKRNVDAFLIDQLGRKSFPLITDDAVSSSYDNYSSGASTIPETEIPLSASVEDLVVVIKAYHTDEYWVAGDTASFPFDQLTAHERQLLKWRYVDGLRPNKISEKTSDHPNTCRQHIKIITDKVKALLEEEF